MHGGLEMGGDMAPWKGKVRGSERRGAMEGEGESSGAGPPGKGGGEMKERWWATNDTRGGG